MKILIVIVTGSLLVLVVALIIFYKTQQVQDADVALMIEDRDANVAHGTHSAYYVDQSFYGDIEALRRPPPSSKKMYGGIISHHFLMAKEIAGLISLFSQQKPKAIVIVGPNHFGIGNGNLLVSRYGYQTPWGIVKNDQEIVNELIKRNVVTLDERPFVEEHSISTLVGFIKYFLPDTKIVPIILKRHVTDSERMALVNALSEILSDDDIVLGSVDFSHHINPIASEFHDNRTISIVNDFDFERLQSVEVDSPGTLDVVLGYLDSIGAKKMRSVNTNMSKYIEDPFLEDGTSYLFANFVRGNNTQDTKVSILSFGDMMFDRGVGEVITAGDDPFDRIQGDEGNFVRGIDIITANLEGPITQEDKCSDRIYSFKFDLTVIELFTKHNFNAINLANNHIFDCHSAGLADTKKYLDENEIMHFGGDVNNKIKIKDIASRKIAFVGIDATLQNNSDVHKKDIHDIRMISDHVVVYIHWGEEYKKQPSAKQIELAHDLIDSGADLIIGHHPHVVQLAEIYKNKPIFYSVGNFIFDQVGIEENQGLGVGVVFSESVSEYYLFPYNIDKYQPELLDMKKAKDFCDHFIMAANIESSEICRFSL